MADTYQSKYTGAQIDERLEWAEGINPHMEDKDNPHEVTAEQVGALSTTDAGDLAELTTTEKGSLVGAINEVDDHADTNATSIGTLASLTTTEKTNLVGAINEVDADVGTNATAIGILASLTTTEKMNLVGAINELDTDKVETSAITNTLTETAAGKVLDARQGKALSDKIGTQTFTEDNYVTDGASDTANIDALDMAVKVNADLVSTNLNATIKNEIKNGDFSGAFVNDPPSIEGWGLWGNSSISGHTWVIEDEKFKTHTTTSYNGSIHQDIPCLINDKYYLTVTFEGSGFTRVGINDYETSNNFIALTSNTSSVGKWSYTFTSNRSGFRLVIGHMVSPYTYTNRTLDNIMLINLTQTFGAGNEPTKEEMDVLILLVPNGYWEGELTLSQKLILNWQLALIRANTLAIASL